MNESHVKLEKPIWNGGDPQIGVADFRIRNSDVVKVRIAYTRADGIRSYPDEYSMSTSKLRTYPTQIVGGGVKLFVAPLSDWIVNAA